MMHLFELVSLLALYTALCLYIIGATVCRVSLLHPRTDGGVDWTAVLWGVTYIGFAFFAVGELIDVWWFRSWDNTYAYELVGLVAVALNLSNTRKLWREGPPASTRRAP